VAFLELIPRLSPNPDTCGHRFLLRRR